MLSPSLTPSPYVVPVSVPRTTLPSSISRYGAASPKAIREAASLASLMTIRSVFIQLTGLEQASANLVGFEATAFNALRGLFPETSLKRKALAEAEALLNNEWRDLDGVSLNPDKDQCRNAVIAAAALYKKRFAKTPFFGIAAFKKPDLLLNIILKTEKAVTQFLDTTFFSGEEYSQLALEGRQLILRLATEPQFKKNRRVYGGL